MPISPTIGVVTAIPEEYVAAKALLDNAKDTNAAKDSAPYVLGRMPSRVEGDPHRVVVTTMNRAGNDIAAVSCTNLQRSFPSVNVIIMCGIACGIPTPGRPDTDVALGDIVVATWGIVDYDHVTETDDGVELRPGIPRPSPFLTNGANLLRAAELEGRRPWERWLGPQMPDLPEHYRRPDTGRGRGRSPAMPRVHYGLIGSADRSLRSARVRDALAAEHDLRALEMEGKGIGNSAFLNGLEWMVVRGISDYGDSSTTRVWRPHAALAAAAYLRALLAECGPLEPRGGHGRGDQSAQPAASNEKPTADPTVVARQVVFYNGRNVHVGDNFPGIGGYAP